MGRSGSSVIRYPLVVRNGGGLHKHSASRRSRVRIPSRMNQVTPFSTAVSAASFPLDARTRVYSRTHRSPATSGVSAPLSHLTANERRLQVPRSGARADCHDASSTCLEEGAGHIKSPPTRTRDTSTSSPDRAALIPVCKVE